MIIQHGIRRVSVGCALMIGFLAAAAARADVGCDLRVRLTALERFADSIRVDKPGLARVYSEDGTEFTAGQALWMKGQLRGVEAACAHGDTADAVRRLAAVNQLLRLRGHQSL